MMNPTTRWKQGIADQTYPAYVKQGFNPLQSAIDRRLYGSSPLSRLPEKLPENKEKVKSFREILTWKAYKEAFKPILKLNVISAVAYAVLAVIYTSSSLPSDEEVQGKKVPSPKKSS